MGVRKIERFTLLDVRQPDEYKSEHIPGAKLIPLPELDRRLNEIGADKPTRVYCAIDGRTAFRIKDHIDRKFMQKFQE